METIRELERYLEEECYSFHEISIGKHCACEGIVIEREGGRFEFGYSERGCRRVLKSFAEEKELFRYALAELKADEWLKGHLAAFAYNKTEIEDAEKELNDMGIRFKRNDIPQYKCGRYAYRIFVFGRDILRLDEFKKNHLRP